MSTFKRKRNRQAFLSTRTNFTDDKEVAGNIANFRCAVPFQDVSDVGEAGITQFQPWMAAVKAAGMQAAAFYKGIVRKGINISKALHADGSFDDQDDTLMEEALEAGLLPIRQDENGGYYWVSDQTTYSKDANFVFNSIQAVYMADVLGLTVAKLMEQSFTGQSVADIDENLAVAALKTILDSLVRLKVLSPSSDAKAGYKNPQVVINKTAMVVSFEGKLAGLIYFVPVFATVSPVTKSAG
jgi:hypothetical protein